MSRPRRLRSLLAATVAAIPLVGCMVGPNFHRPRAAGVSDYTPTPLPPAHRSPPR